MAQWKQIQLGTMRLRVQSLASLSGLRIRYCCRPVATAPIQPLAWKPPYAAGMALKNNNNYRSSRRGTVETNPTRNHEVVGSTPGLNQWVKDPALP